jgi:hypothetical protein
MIQLLINFSAVFAQAIDKPCSVESPAIIPWDEWSKASNGHLQLWEYLPQPVVKSIDVVRPIRGDRIESFKFSQDNISEFYRGISKAISPIVEASEIGYNSGHNESPRYLWDMSPNEINQVFHDFVEGMWYGLIISVVIIFLFAAQRCGSPGARFIGDPVEPLVKPYFISFNSESMSIPQNGQYLIFLETEKGLP